MNKLIVSSVAALALVATASFAHADENPLVSLHLQGGPSEVFHANNVDKVFTHNAFRTGDYGAAELEFHPTSWLGIGPRAAVQYFTPNSNENGEASVLWDFGGAIRLSCPHVAAHGWRPYVAFDGSVDKHGSVWNPSLGGQLGVDFRLDPTGTFWLGPYVGYNHVFQTQGNAGGTIMDGHDVNTGSVGLQLTLDAPVHPVHEVQVQTVNHETVREVPGPVRVVMLRAVGGSSEWFKVRDVVLFQHDSTDLTDEAKTTLDDAAAALAAHTDWELTLEGFASSEGQDVHNLLLSRARGQAVVAYLASKGVDASRLTVAAYGATGGSGDDDLKANRKVEFLIHVKPAANGPDSANPPVQHDTNFTSGK